jgi:hypothetical protein
MAVYNLSPIFKPQYIANAAAAIAFAPPGAGSVVPASYQYQIAVCRVANITGAPVSLVVWRVPSGATNDNQHIVIPQINVPVATQTFPDLDLTALWGVVLQPGDAIWAVAGASNALVIQGDGAAIQI